MINIAIDGPSSSGKSTIAKELAKRLNLTYLDTGAMYRSVTYLALKQRIDLNNEHALANLAKKYPISFTQNENGDQLVWINNENVTEHIRSIEVTNNVSEVSAHSIVREVLVAQQQAYITSGGIIMDGRDIGTVVMPNANLKIFLTASSKVRAERRYRENIQRGIETSFDELLKQIEERDAYDTNRETSPLKKATDAIELDTSDKTIEEVIKTIKKLIKSI
ncbi:(d)CMP kinase [Atopobacter phocae]|uniref:(d)CMP kinase n=1 Tax=Atopobacter phocae TaxID=136492 RepID=UPI0004713C37|nr:(d)CMP kinase [Atopobacter phocae]